MSTVCVFRVECPEQHVGPYHYKTPPMEARYTDWFTDSDRPNSYEDACDSGMSRLWDSFRGTSHCFETLEKCYAWFDAERREKLQELGFVLTMYTVAADRVLHLTQQSLFHRHAVIAREVIEWPVVVDEMKEQKVA